jgi:hypothetical protein
MPTDDWGIGENWPFSLVFKVVATCHLYATVHFEAILRVFCHTGRLDRHPRTCHDRCHLICQTAIKIVSYW